MQHVYFEVKGDPVPKARARTVRKGGRTWSFTPKRVAVWEKTVKEEAAKYFEEPLVGPIQVSLIFYMERPKSRRKDIWVPTTPDLDNLEKAVLDALNGVAYEDDRFVVAVQCHPERTESTPAAFERLWAAFVEACRERPAG